MVNQRWSINGARISACVPAKPALGSCSAKKQFPPLPQRPAASIIPVISFVPATSPRLTNNPPPPSLSSSLHTLQTHNAPVSCVHFSSTAPHDFAVTCSTHVSLHAGSTGRQLRSVGRFDHIAYSAQFRADGKLLGTGDHTGTVKVRFFFLYAHALLDDSAL